MIRLKNVSKIYNRGEAETRALDNISIEIEDGELIAITGPSGTGKTTLLNIIGCMARMTSGSYFYDDIDVGALSTSRLNSFRKEYVSFVFQDFALMEHYTVYENIELPLKMRKISSRKRKEIVEHIMDKTGISELRNKLPSEISGGQKQRCAISRAIVANTPLILADEPTGALDADTSKSIMKLFHTMHEMGKTIIVVTHNMDIAQECDRIINITDLSSK